MNAQQIKNSILKESEGQAFDSPRNKCRYKPNVILAKKMLKGLVIWREYRIFAGRRFKQYER